MQNRIWRKIEKLLMKFVEYIYNNQGIISKRLFILSLTGIFSSSIILILLEVYKIEYVNRYNIDITDILIKILVISIYVLLIPLILINKKRIFMKSIFLLLTGVGVGIGSYGIIEHKKIELISIIMLILFLFFLFWIIIDFVIIIYKWLWVRKDDENTKQMDIAKLNLLWLILAFILGILFNIRK